MFSTLSEFDFSSPFTSILRSAFSSDIPTTSTAQTRYIGMPCTFFPTLQTLPQPQSHQFYLPLPRMVDWRDLPDGALALRLNLSVVPPVEFLSYHLMQQPTTYAKTLVRSMWCRKACPSPRFWWAPFINPGISATVIEKSSKFKFPKFGLRVVKA